MTVAENVVIGSEPVRGVFFDRKKAEAQVAAMIDEYNFHISATAKVETLSVGEQQRVEILKALPGGRPADPGRAHRGAHPPGGGGSLPGHAAAQGRGQEHHYHHPQAQGDHGDRRPGVGACARAK